ncbi:hypothetical protein K505DRAFT_325831 [Melanomma pulvis-pyrius CBS 109.77]|uniref:Phospholipid scramblase n=1 Tax=Melanomma pulvis-pyrius CBS 109.77 TaxID=1314802 RepID=A0A6A6XB32_9PLEO|nr:hypothetical protein K505DRAFT_325831 [Melanomma pulvis-pyrius CBS 109.77]
MSTAIALQDMDHSPSHKDGNGEVRHRVVSKQDTKTAMSTQSLEDEWAANPQDAVSSRLPLDSQSFVPTKTYWISPHGMLTKEIKILDLTPDMDVPYSGLTPAYKDSVKKTLKDHSFSPVFTAHRNNWLGLKYSITDDQGNPIADWKHSWSSVGEAILTFPEDSQHSEHPISLRNKRWGFRNESFTVNSMSFFWGMDSFWHSTNMTLYKVFGSGEDERKVEVGKYAQKWWGGFVTGGTFVVDEKELDGLVACLTLCVVLKKKRQRAAERNPGGGSGGGS